MSEVSKQERQAILAEQAPRLAEAQARAAQPPPEPGRLEALLALLRRVAGAAPAMPRAPTVRDLGEALPSAVMPMDAIRAKAAERAKIDEMLRNSNR